MDTSNIGAKRQTEEPEESSTAGASWSLQSLAEMISIDENEEAQSAGETMLKAHLILIPMMQLEQMTSLPIRPKKVISNQTTMMSMVLMRPLQLIITKKSLSWLKS